MTVPPTPDYSTQAETAPGLIRNAIQVLYGTRDDYAKTRDPRPLIDDFAAGSYRLSPVSQSNRLGMSRGKSTHPRNDVTRKRPVIHRTVRVRAV